MHFSRFEKDTLTFPATNVLSVVNHKNSARADKHIDAVPLLIELDTPYFTHSTVNLSDITQITSSNTSHST
jgi:hypothetical protein